jgi:hypothetical protein
VGDPIHKLLEKLLSTQDLVEFDALSGPCFTNGFNNFLKRLVLSDQTQYCGAQKTPEERIEPTLEFLSGKRAALSTNSTRLAMLHSTC